MIDPESTTVQDEISFQTVRRHGPEATEKFVELIQRGETVKMAEMLVTRTPPRLGITDHTYQRNRVSLLDQCYGSEIVLRAWQEGYRRNTGENLPDDAILMRSLVNPAVGPGDPAAVITHKHSLADVKRMVKLRNLKVEGDWEHEPSSSIAPEVQKVQMGSDLVEKYVDDYISENPDLAHSDRNELREMVVDTHSRKVTVDDLNPHGATDFKGLAKKLFKKRAGAGQQSRPRS